MLYISNDYLKSESTKHLNDYIHRIFKSKKDRDLQKRVHDYLHKPTKTISINSRHRMLLIEWLFEVSLIMTNSTDNASDNIDFDAYFLMVRLLDTVLSKLQTLKLADLQLIGCIVCRLSQQMEIIYPSKIEKFIYISDDTFTKNKFLKFEVNVLNALDFDLCIPTIKHFIEYYILMYKIETKQQLIINYLAGLTCLIYEFQHLYYQSDIALACLCISNIICSNNVVIMDLPHYKCNHHFIEIVRKTDNSTNVVTKYFNKQFRRIQFQNSGCNNIYTFVKNKLTNI